MAKIVSTDELIQLAGKIAGELPKVSRSEWFKWAQLAEVYGLEKALRFAEQLSRDVTLRPAVKRAQELIAGAVGKRRLDLGRLDGAKRRKLFGYVGWLLAIENRQEVRDLRA